MHIGDGTSGDFTLRQCIFISNTASNYYGHAIYTSSSPTIAVINTYFSDPNDNDNIVGDATWKTCSSSSVCTETPFTGTCSAVDSGNAKLGVNCVCATSNTFDCVICVPVNKYTSNDQSACVDCSVGKYTSNDQSACINCGVGKFNNLEGQSDEAVA